MVAETGLETEKRVVRDDKRYEKTYLTIFDSEVGVSGTL